MHTNQKYRADIDGLRAIAVLSVVVYHAFPSLLPGGFIGVDVFFVISGYLITGILLKELAVGSFSLFRFYIRRIRRIFPALLLVLLVCILIGWYLLFDDELKQLGKHVFAGAGFVSNIALWREVGYFDTVAETKPLLHLWSLGIEEQFYLFWPIALWVGFRYKKVAVWVFSLLIILSFYKSSVKVFSDPTEAFYSPITRFWELAVGGVLAYMHVHRSAGVVDRWASEASSFLGCMLLVTGLFLIDKTRSFPGLWAVLPVGAALLFIGPAQGSWFNQRVLSSRPAVFIGLISFPLYLWHWPIMSFSSIASLEFGNPWYRFVAIALSFVLAWITYKVVEGPVRRSGTSISTTVLVLVMIAIGGIGLALYKGVLFEKRNLNSMAQDIGHTKFFDYMKNNYFTCVDERVFSRSLTYEGYTRCIQSKEGKDVDVAIIGDSHAEHLFVGIAQSAGELNVAYYIQASPPYLSNPDYKYIFDFVKEKKSIKKVMVTMHWIQRIHEIPAGSSIETELSSTIEFLESLGKEVYLVDDVPRFPFGPQDCVSRIGSSTEDCSMPIVEALKEFEVYKSQLLNVSNRGVRVKYIPLAQYLCSLDRCGMIIDGRLLYRDNNHLNLNGSSVIGRSIVRDNPDILRGFGGS